MADQEDAQGRDAVTLRDSGPVPTIAEGGALSETVQVAQWITA